MGSDPALALTGRRCVPSRLLAAGLDFAHPTFDSALDDLLSGMFTTRSDPGRRGRFVG